MIASYEHGFIFLKTVKVAGTSVELALCRQCGPSDVITPIHPRDELLRTPDGRRPQNYSSDPTIESAYAAAIDRRDLRTLWRLTREMEPSLRFFNHMRADEIRDAIGAEFWESAFKFTIERNPYDRIVSGAVWMASDRGIKPGLTNIGPLIDECIELNWRNFDFYTIDGRIAVDRVLRYEDLAGELAAIADRIGGDISKSLPWAKPGTAKWNRPASSILTAEQKRRITERYDDVLEALGYPRLK